MERKDTACRVIFRKAGITVTNPEDIAQCQEILGKLEMGTIDRLEAIEKLTELGINPALADRVVSIFFKTRPIRVGRGEAKKEEGKS